MTEKLSLCDALDWKRQLGLAVSFAFVLGLSWVVPIDVCTVGGFGDVSDLLRTIWSLSTGSATLVSFVLAVRKYRAETTEVTPDDESVDSHTAIHVESVEGDVDLNVTLSDAREEHRNAKASSSVKSDELDSNDEGDCEGDCKVNESNEPSGE